MMILLWFQNVIIMFVFNFMQIIRVLYWYCFDIIDRIMILTFHVDFFIIR